MTKTIQKSYDSDPQHEIPSLHLLRHIPRFGSGNRTREALSWIFLSLILVEIFSTYRNLPIDVLQLL